MKQEINEYIVLPEETSSETECVEKREAEGDAVPGDPKGALTREVERYLSDYETFSRMIEMNRYEREYFRDSAVGRRPEEPYFGTMTEESEYYLQAKLYEIRRFILSLPDCEEKLFLYYHYVHRESLMRCAELLDVSRATIYRLKKRALETAARYYGEQKKKAI